MNREVILMTWVIGFTLLIGCDTSLTDDEDTDKVPDWLISESELYDGGPGKDGIPALTDPLFIDTELGNYFSNDRLVLGMKIGDEYRAYPHAILDFHEIINDKIGDDFFAVVYCPLTGTGMAWNRVVNGIETTFGVSGFLYNTNVVPYDRETESHWSQMRLDCINGEYIGTEVELFPIIEITWSQWREMYPNSVVVSEQTGYARRYGEYPYGDYRTNDEFFLFPVSNSDSRVPAKERVHGIIGDSETIIYRFDKFKDGIHVYEDMIGERPTVVVGDSIGKYIVSYYTDENSSISYSAVQGEYPIAFSDSNGNKFDLFGTAMSGPQTGKQLEATKSFIGCWFSWAAFYPELTLR